MTRTTRLGEGGGELDREEERGSVSARRGGNLSGLFVPHKQRRVASRFRIRTTRKYLPPFYVPADISHCTSHFHTEYLGSFRISNTVRD